MFQFTPMVRNLILVNVGMMFLVGVMPQLLEMLALFPFISERYRPYQHVTYMFLHSGLGHIFSNMLALVVFGPMLEKHWGAQRFLAFWLICGVGAGFLYASVRHYELNRMHQDVEAFVAAPSGVGYADFYEHNLPGAQGYTTVARAIQQHPDDQRLIESAKAQLRAMYDDSVNSPYAGMVGASGAVFAILFAFGYLFPNTELVLFPLPVPIKAKYLVFLYGALELYKGTHPVPGDNVAHFAHLGGMLFGFLLLKYWERNSTRPY
ncbi:rhomboid family intramembrane serine protease [Hymenobacter sp. 15J16-1T3B]|uniref:rhomboid family intramembrane serine protease n=1 Tax=Hymenobacter sp. 15J16-1T3B TaxID=2886941 RepID=UPI001D113B35|nr:rhomboid family intramembrane serine protease [Hymenobacter sp. 15J16-1T3B]MCC3158764.1 rhomboid family intramembrane serine protease [Hymenobacter sp. 15J16-1T3B]